MKKLQLTRRDAVNYAALINVARNLTVMSQKRSGSSSSKTGQKAQLNKQKNRCLDCKVKLDSKNPATKEHVIPYRFGSAHTGLNIVWLCNSCNQNRSFINVKQIIEDHYGKINWDELSRQELINRSELQNEHFYYG